MANYEDHVLNIKKDSEVLYRFQPIAPDTTNRTDRIDSIHKDEIWVSSPQTFNDPYDLNLIIDDRTTNAPYQHDFIIQLANLLLEKCETKNPNSLITEEFIDSIRRCIGQYIDIDTFRRIIKEQLTQQGIICLTPHIENTLMWAHYADSHKGFAIEYRLNSAICDDEWYKDNVEYTSKLRKFCFTEILINPNRVLTELALIKSHHWSYENEVRIINKKNSGKSVPLPVGMEISGLYAGLNCSSGMKLKETAHRLNIPFFKMQKKGYCLTPDDSGTIRMD